MTEATYLSGLAAAGIAVGWASAPLAWRRRVVMLSCVAFVETLCFSHGFNRGLDTVDQAVERALHGDAEDEAPALQRVDKPAKPRLVV